MTAIDARCASVLLLAACLHSPGAAASNASSVKKLGIEVHFTQCTDSIADAFHLCGKERWTFEVDAAGWRAEHANLVAGTPGQWTSTCKDGIYEADIGGKAWPGTCRVTGDDKYLCLTSQSAGVVPGEPGGQSSQCFDLSGETCMMAYQGKVWQLNDAGKPSLYLITARDVTTCMISNN